jgi:hypothetical protein
VPLASTLLLASGSAVAADAPPSVSLSISGSHIEYTPLTFTATGTAPSQLVDGESTAYLQGAVLPASRNCPASGADDFGEISGSVVDLFTQTFPAGPFGVTQVVKPNDRVDPESLPAGGWRACAYVQDRESNAVLASTQQTFNLHKPRASIQVRPDGPLHFKFKFDIDGHPIATAYFRVRARVAVPLRVIRVDVQQLGRSRACTRDTGDHGYESSNPYRVKPGPRRSYRVRVVVAFRPGPPPYGRRARVCALLGYVDPTDLEGKFHIENTSQSSVVFRR